jgi:nitroreductase
MDVREAIRNRRSIRKFSQREIPEESIDALIEAIRWAPSAGNLQSRRFYFVLDQETKDMLAVAALGQMFISSAPLVVVACGDTDRVRPYGKRGRELYVFQDAAAAVQNLMLQAHELGLGSVWVGAFDDVEVSRVLRLPDYLRPMAIIPVGYPAHHPSAPTRYGKEEVVRIIK